MIRGLYTSAVGMITQMKKMDVVTNNIANADTTGFKKDIAVTQSFSKELMSRLDDPKYELIKHDNQVGDVSLGVFVSSVHTDFSSGSAELTDGTLDLAIEGDGFFSVLVNGSDGTSTEKYTRDGSFTLGKNGTLLTKTGNVVLSESGGAITLPNGEISINDAGEIYVDNEYIDKLKLVDIENKESLRKYGDNLYDTIDESNVTGFNGKVMQGYLEMSNTNSVQEMVKMITLSRVYEANQKILKASDSALEQAVNNLGKKS